MGYIYKITNTTNGKCYIGQTIKKLEDRINKHFNRSSSPILRNAIEKYGRDAFTVDILHEALDIFLDDLEAAEIKRHNTLSPHGYNLTSGGESNKVFSDRTRQKMSDAHKRRKPVSPETRQKMSKAQKGRTHTSETRQKISDAQKGKKVVSDQTRKKISDARKRQKPLSPEARKKISDAHKGKTFTPEHRQKLSDANKGRTFSLETRRKWSLSRAHPDRPAAYEILNALPEDMSLAERRKILRDKFPEQSRTTVYKWVKKWSETSL